MPGSTTNYALPYPVETDASPDVAAAMQSLASAVDAALHTVAVTVPAVDTVGTSIAASAPADTRAAGSSGKVPDAAHRHARETTATALAGPAALTTYSEALVTVAASGATRALDLSAARNFRVTLSANCTLSFTNTPSTSGVRLTFTLALVQDATGSRTATWPASVKWGQNGAPTLSTAAGKTDVISFVSDDNGTTWLGFIGGLGY